MVEISCNQCKVLFSKKPSDITNNNFCCKSCFYLFKKENNIERKIINKFIKSKWISMNLRCGKYRHIGTKSKNKCYENIIIEFNRDEFKKWCFEQKELILTQINPSIDRINSDKNYSLDNIRIKELDLNIKDKRPGNRYLNGSLSNKERGIRQSTNGTWTARITINCKCEHIGTYQTKEAALDAFKIKYKSHYGKDPF